jgi:hypothetical protein
MQTEATIKELSTEFRIAPQKLYKALRYRKIEGRKADGSAEKLFPRDLVEPVVSEIMKAAIEEAKGIVAGDAAAPELAQEGEVVDADYTEETPFDPNSFVDQALSAAIENSTKSFRRRIMKAIDLASNMDDEDLQLELLQHYVKAKLRIPKVLAAMVLEYSETGDDEE